MRTLPALAIRTTGPVTARRETGVHGRSERVHRPDPRAGARDGRALGRSRSPPPPGSGGPSCWASSSDDFSACGGDFYARGHMRNFARTVGLDPAPLLAEFDAATARGRPAPRVRRLRVRDGRPAASAAGPTGAPRWPPRSSWCVVYGVAQVVTGGEQQAPDGLRRRRRLRRPARPGPPSPSPTASATGTSSAVARAPRDKVTVAVRATARAGCRPRRTAARSCSRAC